MTAGPEAPAGDDGGSAAGYVVPGLLVSVLLASGLLVTVRTHARMRRARASA